MSRVLLRSVLLLGALAVLTQPAEAQRRRSRSRVSAPAAAGRLEFGAHAGYNWDVDQTVVGAQAALPLGKQVDFYPSFDFYTGSNDPDWGLNADLRFRPPLASQTWYVGSGANLLYSSAGTGGSQLNFNVEGGLAGRSGAVRPYIEARLIVGHGSLFQLVGGLNFGPQ